MKDPFCLHGLEVMKELDRTIRDPHPFSVDKDLDTLVQFLRGLNVFQRNNLAF